MKNEFSVIFESTVSQLFVQQISSNYLEVANIIVYGSYSEYFTDSISGYVLKITVMTVTIQFWGPS